MNAALGFDTYLVMRHGARAGPSDAAPTAATGIGSAPSGRLGCYYCNDIVAPADVRSYYFVSIYRHAISTTMNPSYNLVLKTGYFSRA
jgi:hypothetical protein